MKLVRQHVESNTDKLGSTEPSERPVPIPRDMPNAIQNDGTAALKLVHQAAQLIRGMAKRVSDTDAAAQAIYQQAIDDLKFANRCVHSAEERRKAALVAMEEANVQVHEIEKALREAESMLAAKEIQLSTAKLRANAAEARANEADKALVRIEDAIRIHLIDPRPDASRNHRCVNGLNRAANGVFRLKSAPELARTIGTQMLGSTKKAAD
jgi:hypothetical protein